MTEQTESTNADEDAPVPELTPADRQLAHVIIAVAATMDGKPADNLAAAARQVVSLEGRAVRCYAVAVEAARKAAEEAARTKAEGRPRRAGVTILPGR